MGFPDALARRPCHRSLNRSFIRSMRSFSFASASTSVEPLAPHLFEAHPVARVGGGDPLVEGCDPVLHPVLLALEDGGGAIELHALREHLVGEFLRRLEEVSHTAVGLSLSWTSHRRPFVVCGPVVRLISSTLADPFAA